MLCRPQVCSDFVRLFATGQIGMDLIGFARLASRPIEGHSINAGIGNGT
jgi:hypothetical protein